MCLPLIFLTQFEQNMSVGDQNIHLNNYENKQD
jgi:hypothetical protein